MFDFPSFALNHKKGKSDSRPQTTLTTSSSRLSLSLSCRSRHTDARTRKEETKNHIVQSLLHVKLRGKETKLVRVCPLLLLFAANDARICCFFLSGCETTTDETLFLCDGFCCVVCSSLPRRARARERERERQTDRETHLHSSVMMRFVSSQNAGLKISSSREKMMRKR